MKTRRNTKHKVRHRVKRSGHRRSKKGGFGGWSRTTMTGPSWNGQNDGNHFKLSPNGVMVGGVQPAVPEMWGPGMKQTNTLSPPLNPSALQGGGYKRRRGRSKRGGVDFGGFPATIKTGWDNIKIGGTNLYRGFMGLTQAKTASPWVQPAFDSSKTPVQIPKPYVINALKHMH
jgi:hypothetical protein